MKGQYFVFKKDECDDKYTIEILKEDLSIIFEIQGEKQLNTFTAILRNNQFEYIPNKKTA